MLKQQEYFIANYPIAKQLINSMKSPILKTVSLFFHDYEFFRHTKLIKIKSRCPKTFLILMI
ncbi:MAG: hypothetical protein ABJQ39_15185, partial [Winogradskyella arenosi]